MWGAQNRYHLGFVQTEVLSVGLCLPRYPAHRKLLNQDGKDHDAVSHSDNEVAFGTYKLRAIPTAKVYQLTENQTTLATSHAELYVTLQVDKRLAVVGPPSRTGVSLTPRLRWQPVAGAVEITLFNAVAGKFVPLGGERVAPFLTVEKPLGRDTHHSWSIVACVEQNVPIASNYEPNFLTKP